jgi:hypothetical protein
MYGWGGGGERGREGGAARQRERGRGRGGGGERIERGGGQRDKETPRPNAAGAPTHARTVRASSHACVHMRASSVCLRCVCVDSPAGSRVRKSSSASSSPDNTEMASVAACTVGCAQMSSQASVKYRMIFCTYICPRLQHRPAQTQRRQRSGEHQQTRPRARSRTPTPCAPESAARKMHLPGMPFALLPRPEPHSNPLASPHAALLISCWGRVTRE